MRTLIAPAKGVLCFHSGSQIKTLVSAPYGAMGGRVYFDYYKNDSVLFTINKQPYRVCDIITQTITWLFIEEYIMSDGMVDKGQPLATFSTDSSTNIRINEYVRRKAAKKTPNELEEELQRERAKREQEIKTKNEEIAQVRQELSEKNFKRTQQEHKQRLQRIQQQSPSLNQVRPLTSGSGTAINQAFKDIFPEFDDNLF